LIAGTFCSTALSALALSPSCSFLKIQKKTILNKRTVSQASDVVAFVSAVQERHFVLQADKF
jgi:hypothetical protein